MKFKRHLQLEHGLGQMDIAPLINTVLLLLAFFLITSGFVTQSGININLPKAVTSAIVQDNNIDITIDLKNILYLSGKAVTTEQLKERLKKTGSSKVSVLIKADRKSDLGKLVEVWNLCREIGLERVSVITNQEIESR